MESGIENQTKMQRESRQELEGKVILVTGGGRGLGAAICRTLARAGANIMVADTQMELAEELVGEIRGDGGRAQAMRMDVTNPQQVDRIFGKIVSENKRIDAVINNAGVDKTCSIEEMSPEEFDQILSVNLKGPFIVARRALPALRETGGGHIINIVSTAAKRAWPNASAYHASKWGLLGFSHALFTEARPSNVKVTAMICGGMRTPFLLDRFPDIDTNNLQDPHDVAETIRYILSAPQGTVLPEVMALPMRETSWP